MERRPEKRPESSPLEVRPPSCRGAFAGCWRMSQSAYPIEGMWARDENGKMVVSRKSVDLTWVQEQLDLQRQHQDGEEGSHHHHHHRSHLWSHRHPAHNLDLTKVQQQQLSRTSRRVADVEDDSGSNSSGSAHSSVVPRQFVHRKGSLLEGSHRSPLSNSMFFGRSQSVKTQRTSITVGSTPGCTDAPDPFLSRRRRQCASRRREQPLGST